MSWVATAVVGAAVIGAGTGIYVSSKNSAEAAKARQAQADANAAALAAGQEGTDAGIAAQLEMAGLSADAIKYAADRAAAVQWGMYSQSREDMLPWLQKGSWALGELQKKIQAGPGEFTEDPGYKFRLEQGNKNILAKASATGGLASGRTLKALEEYGQDYASNEYDKFLARYYQSLTPYQSLAGAGQTAANTLGNQSMSVGNALGNIYQAQGTQLSNLYQNQGNALSSLYMGQSNNLANYYTAQGNNAMGAAQDQINANTGMANSITGAANTAATGLAYYYANKPPTPSGVQTSGVPTTNIQPYGRIAPYTGTFITPDNPLYPYLNRTR